jgi:hypothetical protein
MSAVIHEHAVGLTWSEPSGMVRAAHALTSEGRVWLIDPFDDPAALDATASHGRPAGVLQLLDRHNRDCETIATRLDVPLMRLPERVPDSPFEVIRVINRPGWKEIALWWAQPRALVVAEAIGTAPAFALGRRAGVHPLLRLVPPRSQFSSRRPEMLLVGHGEMIETNAVAALAEALDHARSDIPRFVVTLPRLVRSR